MESTYKYKATAYWLLERRGMASAESVPQAIEFSAPPEFQGERELWTPEHFLMASIASCYVSTFRSIADASHFDVVALDVAAEGTMTRDRGYRFTEVIIRPVLTVATDEDVERGRSLLAKAEAACPISRSLACTVKLESTVQVSALVGV
jgi:organic hydroperoxide reductase OsmC/OhrA